ncbi:hypothetical protein BHE74_00018521 [Ensete ventricosum]|nr:hypothetical protein GW17_00031152 [Ensete ventricosum]RWW73600.1 hypothetical protein BHE74_00018521 [Ensete ventricosum]RZS11918.1 hypothetical protein BHM03_00043296 [Ensete ventricosum]
MAWLHLPDRGIGPFSLKPPVSDVGRVEMVSCRLGLRSVSYSMALGQGPVRCSKIGTIWDAAIIQASDATPCPTPSRGGGHGAPSRRQPTPSHGGGGYYAPPSVPVVTTPPSPTYGPVTPAPLVPLVPPTPTYPVIPSPPATPLLPFDPNTFPFTCE